MSKLKPKPKQSHNAKHPRHPKFFIMVALIALIAGFAGGWLQQRYDQAFLITPDLTTEKKIATSESRLISQIAKTVGPSVVSVNVSISSDSSLEDIADPFGFPRPRQASGAGTGIIISDSGMVVTNRHVVPRGTTKVSVTLSDGTELKDVSVIGRTNDSDSLDIAFLKINDKKGRKLQPAKIGNSTVIQVGDNVVAIGNALGQLQNTVTSGIVSGFGRSVLAGDSSGEAVPENLDNLLQTDAAINEGNSGGPLVNLNGQVIGINTAIAGNAQNIGFAIPINDVSGLIRSVIKTGKLVRPYLGVRYIALTADIASQLELKTNQGAYITSNIDPASPSIIAGSPAAKAGIKEKDVITAVNNVRIDATHSLVSQLTRYQPGDDVKLSILRGDKKIQITATLGTLPSEP